MQGLLKEITCKLSNVVIINGYEEYLTDEEIKHFKPPKYKNFDLYETEYQKIIKPNRSEKLWQKVEKKSC